MKDVAQFFKLLADEARIQMLWLLFNHRELCVCDLMAAMREPQSKVSRHLAYLRAAGLVLDRREGKWRHYSIAKTGGRLHAGIIDCLGGCLDEVPLLDKDLARLRGLKRRNCD